MQNLILTNLTHAKESFAHELIAERISSIRVIHSAELKATFYFYFVKN